MSKPVFRDFFRTIKGKLTLIALLVLTGLTAIAVTANYSINDYRDAEQLRLLTSNLRSDMLLLRRNEKDFLARKDLSYAETFKKNTQLMNERVTQLEALMIEQASAHEIDDFRAVKNLLINYENSFQSLVEEITTLGLDHNSGLIGQLRSAVHGAEKRINAEQNHLLRADMLMLRRNEKDFTQRLDTKYVKKFDSNYALMMENIAASTIGAPEKQGIRQSMSDYYDGFHQFVLGYKNIGLDQNVGLRGELRTSVHQVEALLDELSGHLVEMVENKVSTIRLVYLVIFFGIAGLVLSALFFTTRSIINPISKLITSINSVTKSCDFSQRSNINSADEIGQIASALDNFYETLHHSIAETNKVMNAVAIGDFSQRTEVEASGDLESLRVAANQSAESVKYTMDALETIMNALENGDFKQRMDDKVEQRFKQNVDNAMQSMDSAITEISEAMVAMNDGNFSQRIEAPLSGELHGLKELINRSIGSVDQAVSEIVEVSARQTSGDLTHRIEGNYNGQLGILKNSMNETMAHLEKTISDLRASAATITVASEEIASGNITLSDGAEQQASALEETASSMEEISSQVKNTSDHAQHAKELSDNAKTVAEEGGVIVKKAIVAMEDINTSSAMIANIIDVINEIAFQTNLLALNASVEAARAGTQGRGFAVVATEVGALAGRSATAAKEIKDLIENSVEKVKTGTHLVNDSGNTLDEIVAEMEKVQMVVSEIAVTSKEQTIGLEQVNSSIRNMDNFTRNNSVMAENARKSSETLQKQARDMDDRVEFFKVSDRHQASDSNGSAVVKMVSGQN